MAADPARAEPADETDADLLLLMAMRSDDATGAAAAWAEFYRRHVPYLYAVCLRAYAGLLGGEPGVADLVADTFHRAYERAETFEPGGIEDPDRIRRRVRAWLGRIAQRLFQTAMRARASLPTVGLDPDRWQDVGPPPRPPAGDPRRIERVREAMRTLSEREQTVLRVTFQWYQLGRDHQRLPNDVAAELAEALRTTPENLRQIRRRALRKIEAYLRQPEPVGLGLRARR